MPNTGLVSLVGLFAFCLIWRIVVVHKPPHRIKEEREFNLPFNISLHISYGLDWFVCPSVGAI